MVVNEEERKYIDKCIRNYYLTEKNVESIVIFSVI